MWQHQRGEEDPDKDEGVMDEGAMDEERNNMICCR